MIATRDSRSVPGLGARTPASRRGRLRPTAVGVRVGATRAAAAFILFSAAFVHAGPPVEPAKSPYPPSPEATRFFERLVERYRHLFNYADRFLLEQEIGSSDGDERATTRTRVAARSRVDGDRLEVSTEGDRVWDAITGGTTEPARTAPGDGHRTPRDEARRGIRRDRDLALAPHLQLRFLDEPLREFRSDPDECFRATGIAPVRHADRDMVRIELRSGGESPGSASSVIGITVDPGSMLIRKFDGEEQFSDGRSRTTTISIEPDAPGVDPGPSTAVPTTEPAPTGAPAGASDPSAATMGLG